MGIFKKSLATFTEKMNLVSNVMTSEDTVKFELNYSSITVRTEKIPSLLADVTAIYVLVKPLLDKKTEELEKSSEPEDKPIDLSAIPF